MTVEEMRQEAKDLGSGTKAGDDAFLLAAVITQCAAEICERLEDVSRQIHFVPGSIDSANR